jgi:homoserine kinase
MSKTVKVRVPGTTANCGPGFDAVGIACTIYNELELTLSTEKNLEIEIVGDGRGIIPIDHRNVVWQAIQQVLAITGTGYQGARIKMMNHVPLARGLGSSAAAIVAGLVAANAATEGLLSKQEIFELATQIEGHPDNVAPALYGGVTLSAVYQGHAQCLRFLPPLELSMVVAVPEFNLSTKDSRQVLPEQVAYQDAVFNISRAALLIGALSQGEFSFLKCALEDKIHQPYREQLIPGMQDVFNAANEMGALGAAISGAGPCLIAFTQQNTDRIGAAMVAAFQANKIEASYLVLNIDKEGAKVLA